MSVAIIVGTQKGAAVMKSADRKTWTEEFVLRGWPVTASARDDRGRVYLAVTSPNYGVAIFVSDDLENWSQMDSAPRYAPEDRGNPE
ncbi:MAG: exo-alpha-sialidase, partial [Alphaproteobacteria bacterium]|nr:exo-alpha-sialidase [Alphaproteobacteria bacterium]